MSGCRAPLGEIIQFRGYFMQIVSFILMYAKKSREGTRPRGIFTILQYYYF